MACNKPRGTLALRSASVMAARHKWPSLKPLAGIDCADAAAGHSAMPSSAQAPMASLRERRGKNGRADSMVSLAQAACQIYLSKTVNIQKPLVDTANDRFAALQKISCNAGD
jgi:hypothetical protein